jgi:translocator assembly and maintenance protein 41
MVDLIFGVDDVRSWHRDNMSRNKSHYSSLSWLGSGMVARVNQWGTAGLYFNTDVVLPLSHHSLVCNYYSLQPHISSLVILLPQLTYCPSPFHMQRIKYGVVEKKRLCDDLTNWSALYVAGRMHKPVCVSVYLVSHWSVLSSYIYSYGAGQTRVLLDNDEVRAAQQVNVINAFRTALLLLPEHFTDEQLWQAITAISYEGDVRMGMYLLSLPTQ